MEEVGSLRQSGPRALEHYRDSNAITVLLVSFNFCV